MRTRFPPTPFLLLIIVHVHQKRLFLPDCMQEASKKVPMFLCNCLEANSFNCQTVQIVLQMQAEASSNPLYLCGSPISFLFPISSSYSTFTLSMYTSNHALNFSNKNDWLDDRRSERISPWKCLHSPASLSPTPKKMYNNSFYQWRPQATSHYTSDLLIHLLRLIPHWLTFLFSLRNRAIALLMEVSCFFSSWFGAYLSYTITVLPTIVWL